MLTELGNDIGGNTKERSEGWVRQSLYAQWFEYFFYSLPKTPNLQHSSCNEYYITVISGAGMPKLSKEAKQRLQQLFKGGQFAIRWGFIPVVLYLGFRRGADPGMPEPTIWSLLWG